MRKRLQKSRDLHLERMFETRSEAWERVGVAMSVNKRLIRRARGEIAVFLPLGVGVLVLYHYRVQIFGKDAANNKLIQWGTVVVLLAVGWALARAIGRAAGPTFFRRMDPATAGTVGFI